MARFSSAKGGASISVNKCLNLLDQFAVNLNDLEQIRFAINHRQGQVNYDELSGLAEEKWDECTIILETIADIQNHLDTDEHDHFALVILRIHEQEKKKLELMMLQLATINNENQSADVDKEIEETSELIKELIKELKSFKTVNALPAPDTEISLNG